MAGHRIFAMPFARVYPALVAKAERKGRTKAEVDEIVAWLTGYDQAEYEALKIGLERISGDVATLMLRQAANILLGYPSISVEACAEHLGFEWRARLSMFLGLDSN